MLIVIWTKSSAKVRASFSTVHRSAIVKAKQEVTTRIKEMSGGTFCKMKTKRNIADLRLHE